MEQINVRKQKTVFFNARLYNTNDSVNR